MGLDFKTQSTQDSDDLTLPCRSRRQLKMLKKSRHIEGLMGCQIKSIKESRITTRQNNDDPLRGLYRIVSKR